MKTPKEWETSPPSVEEMRQFFERQAAEGDTPSKVDCDIDALSTYIAQKMREGSQEEDSPSKAVNALLRFLPSMSPDTANEPPDIELEEGHSFAHGCFESNEHGAVVVLFFRKG